MIFQHLNMGKPNAIFVRTALLAVLLCLGSSTLLTFYVDHEVEQPLDFVEINAVVKANGESLEQTIQEVAGAIGRIESLVDSYCKTYTPRAQQKTECSEMIEVSPYSIKPQYELLKSKELFGGFIVAHEIFLRVKETEGFGQLIDDIMKTGINKINSLEWKPKEQSSGEEEALEEGVQQAKAICKKIGSQLAKIVTVEEVTDFGEEQQEDPEQPQGQEEEQEDEEEEEEEDQLDIKDDIVYYKFVVECQRAKGI